MCFSSFFIFLFILVSDLHLIFVLLIKASFFSIIVCIIILIIILLFLTCLVVMVESPVNELEQHGLPLSFEPVIIVVREKNVREVLSFFIA